MPQIFDTSFHSSSFQGSRYGQAWTTHEYKKLRELFESGAGLETICREMQRPAAGVLPKLTSLKLIYWDVLLGKHVYAAPVKPSTTKGKAMKLTGPIVIKNQTLVNGVAVSEISNSELYELIATEEATIERLSQLKHQPRRLKDEIAARQKGVEDLVALLDSQDQVA